MEPMLGTSIEMGQLLELQIVMGLEKVTRMVI
jgi:hypothetical protein